MIDQANHDSRPSSTQWLIWLCVCIGGFAIAATISVGQSSTVRSASQIHAVFAPGMTPAEMAEAERKLMILFAAGDVIEFSPGERWPGVIGEPVELTYSFLPDGAPTTNGPNVLDAVMTSAVGPDWQDRFDQAISAWTALTGNSITLIKDDGAAFFSAPGGATRGDIRIAAAPIDGAGGVLSFAAPPPMGDVLLDASENWGVGATDLFLRNVLAHEIGHALGLLNVCPADGTKLMEAVINLSFDGPQLDDRLGIQWLYGDPLEPNDSLNDATSLETLGFETGAAFEIELVSVRADEDADFFRFDGVASDTIISLVVTPVGITYPVGGADDQGACVPAPFDSLRQVDLVLEVLDSSGEPVAMVNEGDFGEPEAIQNLTLQSTGPYFIRVRGSDVVAGETPIQEYRLEFELGAGVAADLNGDGVVNGADLASLLSGWGACPPPASCPADLNHDDSVDGADLAALLAAWTG